MPYDSTMMLGPDVDTLDKLKSKLNLIIRKLAEGESRRISNLNLPPSPRSGEQRFDDSTGTLQIYSRTLGEWTQHEKD